ncbi:hypothetical protein A33Q_3556 [Indibacter alkaliphilus LW1]|uniref:DUF4249 domain-containing protein n=1 Tax=Indibacter alkaliphilus (strain CCUG 57479 / KCTC 22604 / LW1) TaxID=1189612 RepID=S2D9E9_INDAL|nr:DUF4249 family protein [Indibacter alkaliphilus]EOZ93610.1 hypothetical protein A33Q_3556 [Indibacter alkaliphilus LW1]
MKKRFYIPLLIILGLFSCQEEVFLDLRNTEPIPVIEAFWTDNGAINFVKISESKDYYDTEPNQIISDAEVSVTNTNTGQTVGFLFSPQSQRYLPLNNFGGIYGEDYELNIKIGENEYQSRGTLLEPPSLDSITYEFKEARVFREEGYYITLYGDIPFEDDNYYRIRLIRNDTLLNNRNDYLLFDDTFGTSILNRGFELGGFPFKENDRVRLELFRLNRDAYNYLNQLVGLLFNDGGLFSPPPQNPESNIQLIKGNRQALGYFMVSPFLSATVLIEPD